MVFSVNILGPLVIECNSVPLPKVPRKARALLAYLATQGGKPISRERLADLLWPYQGSDQSRHSLRNCLLQLRHVLGQGTGHHLVSEFADCRLIEVDVDLDRCKRLARSAERGDLLTAAECYRGEFLADFVLDSEPFQEWLTAERDNALELVCGILQRLTGLQGEAGDHDAAIRSARRWAALDTLSEIGHRALIGAYWRAGRRAEALRQYRICAEILKRELGITPDPETVALAAAVASSGGDIDSATFSWSEQRALSADRLLRR